MKRLVPLALAFLAACAAPPEAPPTRADRPALPPMVIPSGGTPTAPQRANERIGRDILDLVFLLETGRTVPLLTRFEGPVTLRVIGRPAPTLGPDLSSLLARLRSEAGVPITRTDAPEASITIQSLPRAELSRAVPGAACFVAPGVSDWQGFLAFRGTLRTDWTQLTTRTRAAIFVPNDVAPQEIRDCLHEELAQALGPLNDLYRLPDSIFNDDNIHSVLTGFDMLVLRAIYDPGLRSGLSRPEVAARLPAILARLNPGGQRPAPPPVGDPGPAFAEAVEDALAADRSRAARQRAAERAVAATQGMTGPERGFALYLLGRTTLTSNPGTAIAALAEAEALFAARPETALHRAHVLFSLAAHALSQGDYAAARARAEAALPIAQAHENAALLSGLLLVRAEALDAQGQRADAAAVRLDSLGLARYGFGSDNAVWDRAEELADLSPANGG